MLSTLMIAPVIAFLQAPVAGGQDPLRLFMETGWMGKFVFLVLALLSISSWAVMPMPNQGRA